MKHWDWTDYLLVAICVASLGGLVYAIKFA